MILSVLRSLRTCFRPLLVALFSPGISWNLRWRLLILQQASFLTYTIESWPYWFSRPFTVEYLPVDPSRSLRALVFKSTAGKGDRKGSKLRPIHVDIHGGAWLGGLPEGIAPWDERVAAETGAVVVSLTYRYSPENTFPAAIDDIDAAVAFIQKNATQRWGADPTLMTIGGFSSGGNLAMAATQQPNCHAPSPTAFKASVIFQAVLDPRLSAAEKPRSGGLPSLEKDPTRVLIPLFDAYAAKAKATHFDDPRLSPILAARETLPERILIVIAGKDILVAEQTAFAERINEEDKRAGWEEGRVQTVTDPDGFHGAIELPDMIFSRELKERSYGPAVRYLKETHRAHGWVWET